MMVNPTAHHLTKPFNYCCLEHHVLITSTCPVIEVVLKQMAGLKVTSLPEPCTVSYLVYELGALSDLQVGDIMYN